MQAKLVCPGGLCARRSWRMQHPQTRKRRMLVPPALPVKDHKSVGAVGREPEDGPWSPNSFDPVGDPDGITEEFVTPRAMQHQLESCAASGWSQGSPFL